MNIFSLLAILSARLPYPRHNRSCCTSLALACLLLPVTVPAAPLPAANLAALPTATSLAAMAGLGLVEDPARRALYLLNHPEYDADTLEREYERDRARGIIVARPDPARTAAKSWDAVGRALYTNWLSEITRQDPRDRPVSALDLLIRARSHDGCPAPAGTRH